MKKNKGIFRLLVVAVLFFSVNVYGQSPIKVGVKLGGNYSKLKVLDYINNPPSGTTSIDSIKSIASAFKGGFHIGPWARLSIKKFYFQPEVLMIIKSVSYDITKTDPNNPAQSVLKEAKLNIYDADVNLLFGYYLVDLPLFKLRANMGPIYTITLGGRQVGFEDVSASLNNVNIKDLYETRQNMGYQLGAGVDIGQITLDLYYQGSFSKLKVDLGTAGTLEQRLNLFKFSIGWAFI